MDLTGRQGDLRALGVFEGKVQNDHDELYELLGDPPIGILGKIESLRWLGHIARRPVSSSSQGGHRKGPNGHAEERGTASTVA